MTALPAAALALALTIGPGRNARPPAGDPPAAGTAPAASDAELGQRIAAYLGSFDTPIPAARWKALGPRAVPLLAAAARDRNLLPGRRARAVGALGVIGGDEARLAVLAAARAPEETFAVRATALHAAAQLVSGKALVRELRPIMERDGEPALRAVAAEVIARNAGPSGCAAVRAQADREPVEARAHFRQALDRCGQEP